MLDWHRVKYNILFKLSQTRHIILLRFAGYVKGVFCVNLLMNMDAKSHNFGLIFNSISFTWLKVFFNDT